MTEKQFSTLKDRLTRFKESIEVVEAIISDVETCESDVSKTVLVETARKTFQETVSQKVFEGEP